MGEDERSEEWNGGRMKEVEDTLPVGVRGGDSGIVDISVSGRRGLTVLLFREKINTSDKLLLYSTACQ